MPRYKLFLLERPAGNPRAIERAAWALPSALDVPRLTKALKAEIPVDWLEIASSDRKREIVKIQQALGAAGCMLAFDDGGSTLGRDLSGAIRETLSAEARRQARERERTRSILERGGAASTVRNAVVRHGRSVLSWLAAIAVMGGSIVLLLLWLGTGEATGSRPDASTLSRLAAFGRSDMNLPAIPDSADGDGGAEPAEPTSGGLQSLPAESGSEGARPAIPDVPSGGRASPARTAPPKSKAAEPASRALEVAGFVVGICWAGGFEILARRARRRSPSRAMWIRVVPTLATSAVILAALVWAERPAPPTKATAPAKSAVAPSAPLPRRTATVRTPARASQLRPTAGTPRKSPPKSYRELIGLLAPSSPPCANAGSALQSFLCLERLRRPNVAEGLPPDSAAATDAEPAEASRTAEASSAPASRTLSPAPERVATSATAPAPKSTRPGSSANASGHPSAAPVAGATSAGADTGRSSPLRRAPAVATAPSDVTSRTTAAAGSRVASPSARTTNPPTGATSSPAAGASAPAPTQPVAPNAAPSPPVTAPASASPSPPAVASASRRSIHALPTFLLGLIAGSIGLSVVALGSPSAGARRAGVGRRP